MRWMSQNKFTQKALTEILAEYQYKADLVRTMSYLFWLRLTAPLNTKNDELAVAISAAARAIILGYHFDDNQHDLLSAQCQEGYEAGFIVRDIIYNYE